MVAPSPRLAKAADGDQAAAFAVVTVQATILHVLRERMVERHGLPGRQAVLDYLRAAMAFRSSEQLRVLYLDAGLGLITDEVASTGTATAASFQPRILLTRALEVGAASMILAHNHPSGDPAASRADVDSTIALDLAARPLGIVLHDHLIVASSGYTSMRDSGVLGS